MVRPSASGVLLVVVVALVLLGLSLGQHACARRGGHYVRALWGMECIK
jgi:hypothetical protein